MELLDLLLMEKDLEKKAFIFPAGNKKAVVRVDVSLPGHPLTNITVCLRFKPFQARPAILFSYYAKNKGKAFQIKYHPDHFNLLIGGMMQMIAHRNASPSEWQHICVAWNSTTGLVHCWHNGELLPRFVMRKGYKMSPNGTILLGQERDFSGKKDSFLGEMADVNIWLHVLKPDEIHSVWNNEEVPNSVVSWKALNYTVRGDVLVEEALHQVS
ncbi:C-reactive protein-like [Thamnophis elegans]|uniref:C-reactive protein-like n=1 Tax=Thamnophis elegans TaxID=35005 RepID=UPI001377BF14|nr:C-reactive protein-like [Thamnophis elegans]